MALGKRARWLLGAIGLAVLAIGATILLVSIRPGSGGPSPLGQRTASPTLGADQQAANGPLVGDPGLVSQEQSCLKANPNRPWYRTIAAFEVSDSGRTHNYVCAHFGGSMSGPNQVFAFASANVYETPYNIVGKGPDQLFIYGGGYGDNPTASGSFVSSVAPGTLEENWRRVLINTNATNEWNYPGVLNALNDGSLVVIYGYHIARLDPATGEIEALTELPTGGAEPRDTAYNGYDALPDGTIIAKTVNRQKGCAEEGFSAFLDCPNPQDTPPSVMVAVDPTTLDVISQITLPEMIGGRVTTATFQGRDYVYLPGTSKLYRYTFEDGRFAADTTWGPVPYLTGQQTAASAMAVMGDHVVAMTNGGAPTSTPMSVIAVSQADSSTVLNLHPFPNSQNSFIPSMVSVDPESNRIYVMDAGAGRLGCVELRDGRLSVVWNVAQTTLSFTTLIGPADQRVLIGTDIPIKFFQQLRSYTTEQVVWRDAATGKELARSDQFPKMSPGILVTPGFAGLQYFLTYSGQIISMQVIPTTG